MDRNELSTIPDRDRFKLSKPGERVVAPAGAAVDQVEINVLWAVVRRRWIAMLAALLITLAVGVVYTLTKKPVYESRSLVTVVTTPPVPGRSDDVRLLNDLLALTRNNSVTSHIQMILSPEVLQTAIARLDPMQVKRGFGANTVPRWAIDIGIQEKTSEVISVVARSYDPVTAADLANGIVTTYIERDQAFSSLATRQARHYVFNEMQSVEKQLVRAQSLLADYKRKTGLIFPESQLPAISGNIISLQMDLDKANVEATSAQRQVWSLGRMLAAQGDEVEESKTIQLNPQYQAALARLDELNAKKASLRQEYAPASKEIQRINGQIADAERQLKTVAETVVASKVRARNPVLTEYLGALVSSAAADARARALRAVVANRTAEMDKLPDWERNMAGLTQKVSVLSQTYQSLSEKYYVLLVNEKSAMPNARQASAAYPSPTPAIPNKKMNAAVFLLLGLMLSAATAAVAERLDKKVRSEALVSSLIGERPIAVIPNVKSLDPFQLQIANPGCEDSFVEAFRSLRAVINFLMEKNPLKLLAVASPGRSEGKTTVSVNLAVAMAMDGKKVLLMDCDLRRPSIRAHMNLPGGAGFTSVVNGVIGLDEAIVATNIRNLYCLPSGPYQANPAEFLNSQASRDVLRTLAQSYDAVILDCPPGAGLSDMQVVSRIVDGVLLVVCVDHTLRPSLYDAVRRLAQVDAPLIGHVLNRLDMQHSGYVCYQTTDDAGVAGREDSGVVDITPYERKTSA